MKAKKLNKKLKLNKVTISNLGRDAMSPIKGGGVTLTCTCGTSVGPDCTDDPECTNIACETYETEACCVNH
jgi:natural product precursor